MAFQAQNRHKNPEAGPAGGRGKLTALKAAAAVAPKFVQIAQGDDDGPRLPPGRPLECPPLRLKGEPSLSGGNRRVLFDELALLQLRPELGRDLDLHRAKVSDDLLLAGGADDEGRGEIRRR